MSTLVTLFHVLVAIYRFIVSSWNAYIVLLQVVRSVVQEAKQEATELMALLDDGAPMMDTVTSTSLLHDAGSPTNPWQMLIIARASSFVLLLRLSKGRVLHLEVDEKFITAKLEVIRSELMLHVQHIPRLLQMPIGMHDTRLVQYTPMRLPYLWKEEQAGHLREGEGGVAEKSIVPATPASAVSAGGEGRSHRKRYVQLLTESALRRRMYMDRVGRAGVDDATPKIGRGVMKTHGEHVIKRRALANATNVDITRDERSADVDGTSDETCGPETGVADTPKQVRMERNIHAALSENLSIPNMTHAALASLRKADESVPQARGRRMPVGPQSLRRKRGQFDLYTQVVSSEFSLSAKMGQGRD